MPYIQGLLSSPALGHSLQEVFTSEHQDFNDLCFGGTFGLL